MSRARATTVIGRLLLLAHTIRYLKPIQIWRRIIYCLYRPSCEHGPAPPTRGSSGVWQPTIAKAPSMTGPNSFNFLNVERTLAFPADWAASGESRLWDYNLHYFDDLNAAGAADRVNWHRDLIARWIRENPAAEGTGWEPYPVSLRIVNWVKWSLSGQTLDPPATDSLAVQTRWLCRRLEYHLLGNHLIANAKALVFAGLFFSGEEAEHWLRSGVDLLIDQLHEQVLHDGGHFERSPMYHHIIVEDVLDVINLFRWQNRQAPAGLVALVPRMAAWADNMQHPDGGLAFFNDCALDVAPTRDDLRNYALRLGRTWPEASTSSILLSASGYGRLVCGPCTALVDVAPVGPDYLPGHGHADTLSLEVSVGTARILVNSGTSVYGADEERQRQRGTSAHNTVTLDGQNSSEVWAGFRVGRRAPVHDIHLDAARCRIEAWHNGYRRLTGRPAHHRVVTLDKFGVDVVDEIRGSGIHKAEGFFHFHPDVTINSASSDTGVFSLSWSERGRNWHGKVMCEGADRMRIDRSATWHPRFGVSLPTTCVSFEVNGRPPFRVATRFQIDH